MNNWVFELIHKVADYRIDQAILYIEGDYITALSDWFERNYELISNGNTEIKKTLIKKDNPYSIKLYLKYSKSRDSELEKILVKNPWYAVEYWIYDVPTHERFYELEKWFIDHPSEYSQPFSHYLLRLRSFDSRAATELNASRNKSRAKAKSELDKELSETLDENQKTQRAIDLAKNIVYFGSYRTFRNYILNSEINPNVIFDYLLDQMQNSATKYHILISLIKDLNLLIDPSPYIEELEERIKLGERVNPWVDYGEEAQNPSKWYESLGEIK